MLVSIHQPQYLGGYLGYLAKIAASDLHIVLDCVNHEPHSFENRNKIRLHGQAGTSQAWQWLTVPLKHPVQVPIREVEIDNNQLWSKKHLRAVEQAYIRSNFYGHYVCEVQSLFQQRWTHLLPCCMAWTHLLMREWDIQTPMVLASSLYSTCAKSDLILSFCCQVGADVYLSGPLGRNYLDEAAFAAAGIEIRYHDYRHPTYPQVYPGFEPYMCSLDALFGLGPQARELLGGRTQ